VGIGPTGELTTAIARFAVRATLRPVANISPQARIGIVMTVSLFSDFARRDRPLLLHRAGAPCRVAPVPAAGHGRCGYRELCGRRTNSAFITYRNYGHRMFRSLNRISHSLSSKLAAFRSGQRAQAINIRAIETNDPVRISAAPSGGFQSVLAHREGRVRYRPPIWTSTCNQLP
jgi:hypothetical protein